MTSEPKWDIASRHLYLCTPIRDDLVRFVESAIKGGVDLVQLREKTAEAKVIVQHARQLRSITRDLGVPFIVNDRPDIALEVEADGVHVGQDDVGVDLVRKILPDAIVGLSTHSEEELRRSLAEEVDYISAGPIVATPTKPGRDGTGTQYAEKAVSRSSRPVFVTGGVNPSVIKGLVSHGVKHFVVVRYLTQSSDPFKSARELKTAIREALDNQ